MRIHYLKMHHYRQYVDTRIDFSANNGKLFSVIQGVNGTGKTNILNAITWCLYGEEKHLGATDNKKLPLANEKVFYGLQPGQTQKVSVELGLGREDIVEYVITRSAQVLRRIDGEFQTAVNPDPHILYLVRGNWKESDQPTLTIKSILPEKISQFFLFDGERLDKFFQRDSADQVKRGIEDVSQIDLLDLSRRHLDRVNTKLMKQSTGVGKADEEQQKHEEAKEELKTCKDNLASLHKDLDGIEENMEAISTKLRESSEEEVRRLQEERDNLNDAIDDYDGQIEKLISKASEKLRQAGPIIYTHAALTETMNLIQSKVKHGELPPKVREPFFKELLDHNECICGTALPEGSEARQQVLTRMQTLHEDDYMDKAADGRYRIESLLKELPGNIEAQKELRGEIRQYEDAIRAHRRRLKEISEKIEQLGGEIDLEEIGILEQQLKEFDAKRTETNRLIGGEETKIKELEKKRDKALRDYQKALRDEKKSEEILARSEICVQALELLDQVKDDLLQETRQRIQEKTEEYFLELIWKKATYKSVKIDPSYRLSVENIRGLPALGSLSAGERQVLALAFMAALGTISGFDAPVVIDTPTGRISGKPRENIAEALPNYLQNTQAIFLMTDTEYTDSVRVRMKANVGKEYDLRFDEDDGITDLIPR